MNNSGKLYYMVIREDDGFFDKRCPSPGMAINRAKRLSKGKHQYFALETDCKDHEKLLWKASS